MKPTMSSDNKAPIDTQQVHIVNASMMAANDVKKSSKLTKKHGLIAAVSLLSIGLVVTCVLVAIRLYTDSQLEIVKYSTTFKDNNGKNINQTVSVADNSVIYHVVQDGVDAYILQDFDKNVQLIKAKNSGGGVMCFVSPLNRSMADTPDSIPSMAPFKNQTTNTKTVKYSVLMDPINDITFLGTRASEMCNNIPTYWQVKDCDSTVSASRTKRGTIVVVVYRRGDTIYVDVYYFPN